MTERPYVLAETTWKTVDPTPYSVAVLPWGATEAHNYHLPYGTDNIQSERIAILAAERAWSQGATVVVLPTVPFGVNTTQLDIKLTINLNPSTQAAVLGDIVSALDGQGIHKLVIVNGHGGNDFRQMIRELQPKTNVFLSTINWWSCVDVKQFIEESGDHAGEAETAAMMHLVPELVRPLERGGIGARAAVEAARGARRLGVGAAAVDAGDGRYRHWQSGEGDGGERARHTSVRPLRGSRSFSSSSRRSISTTFTD